jgi:hypothetical protein
MQFFLKEYDIQSFFKIITNKKSSYNILFFMYVSKLGPIMASIMT